jgi:hypothetical protein
LSPTRLDALTTEQKQNVVAYRAQRSRTGTTEADRSAAEGAIAEIYAAGGLAPPERIIWMPSPTALARDWLAKGGASRSGPNVRSTFTGLIDGARNGVFNAVTAGVWETVERGTAHAPASTAALGVRNSVVAAVDRLRLGLTLGVRSWFGRGERRAAFRDSSWSLIDALDYNLPAYRYFGEAVGIDGALKRIGSLWTLSTTTGWIVPHERICWVSDLPVALNVDETGRLHSGTEAALRYADGWRVYAWKGIVVPEWVVNRPELVTVKAIDRQPNPWIRRCMIEILTPERYIALGGATCVSRDATGKLWRRQWWGPGDDAWAAVEVLNGTAEPDGTFKRYFLQVPANVRTAREAVAWTYGLTDSQYANLVLRT